MENAADERSWSVLFDTAESPTDQGVGLEELRAPRVHGPSFAFTEEATVIDAAAALGVPPAPSVPAPVRATPTPPPLPGTPKGRAIHVLPSAALLRRELGAGAALSEKPEPVLPVFVPIAQGALRDSYERSSPRLFLLSMVLVATMFAHYFMR